MPSRLPLSRSGSAATVRIPSLLRALLIKASSPRVGSSLMGPDPLARSSTRSTGWVWPALGIAAKADGGAGHQAVAVAQPDHHQLGVDRIGEALAQLREQVFDPSQETMLLARRSSGGAL